MYTGTITLQAGTPQQSRANISVLRGKGNPPTSRDTFHERALASPAAILQRRNDVTALAP